MKSMKTIRALMIALAMLAGLTFSHTALAQVSIGISVGFPPPVLPVYEQPICPGDGFIWTPGYWAWDDDGDDYYWVPGTWVEAPVQGYLWTPPYWGYQGSRYVFFAGYWGPRVGFYGGIDYGFGYTGRGYEGGRWEGNRFFYNRSVNNVTNVRNVYNTTIVNNVNVTRVSYNGGNGGVNVRATQQEEQASRERHVGQVAAQNQQIQSARSNHELRATENHGRPPIAATSRPGSFSGGGVVAAREGGNYNPPANRGGNHANRPANDNPPANETNRPASNPNRPANASNRPENNNRVQPNDRPPYAHANQVPQHTAPENSNANTKYQQQQEKLIQKQQQEHQKLQHQQEQEHQKMTQQKAPAAKQQQIEQRHQQQTQHMEQKHQQQQQKMDQQQPRQQAPAHQNQDKKPH